MANIFQNIWSGVKDFASGIKISNPLESVKNVSSRIITGATEKLKAQNEKGGNTVVGPKAEIPEGRIGIKLPFIQKQLPILDAPVLSGLIKFTMEFPERMANNIKDTWTAFKGGVVPPPTGDKLNVNSYINDMADMYSVLKSQGHSETTAKFWSTLYGAGSGILDVTIVGGLLERGAMKALTGSESLVAKKQAWEVLGMPETQKQANANWRAAQTKFATPGTPGGLNPESAKILNNAWEIIKKEGIPNMIERKVVPNVRQFARTLLSEPGAQISESVRSPLVSGELPGYRPEGGVARPRVGFQLEPVEPVGYGKNVPKQDLSKEARKYKTAEEFVKAEAVKRFPKNPISNERLVMEGENPIAGLELTIRQNNGGEILLNNIRSLEEGKGFGTKALSQLKQFSDETGYRITGDIKPTGTKTLNQKQLTDFYKKNGFEISGKDIKYTPVKTKSQLTDIWEKANKIVPESLLQEVPLTPEQQLQEQLSWSTRGIIKEEAKYLKSLEEEAQGPMLIREEIPISDTNLFTAKGEVISRLSDHSKEYSKFYKENKHAPSGKDWEDIARKNLEQGKSALGLEREYASLLAEEKAATAGFRPTGKEYSVLENTKFLKEIKREVIAAYKKRGNEEKSVLTAIYKSILKQADKIKGRLRSEISVERIVKKIGGQVLPRLKEKYGIETLKTANPEQLRGLLQDLKALEAGTNFLSKKTFSNLEELAKEVGIEDLKYMPIEKVMNLLGETKEVASEGLLKYIPNEFLPSVEITRDSPLISRIVDNANKLTTEADNSIKIEDGLLRTLLDAAQKSRAKLLPLSEKVKRGVAEQDKEIFQAMSGGNVKLTPEEQKVVDHLKKFFANIRDKLQLEKIRQNYITHLEKPFTEKIVSEGIVPAIRSIWNTPTTNLPKNLMLELDNIVGSEKFFKFALERKGGLSPTTNISKIVHDYNNVYQTKVMLDKLLPESQAIMNVLLPNKSAKWTKQFLQNMKGRGLDADFKRGKAGWLSKTAEGIIDFNYIALLGINPLSIFNPALFLKQMVSPATNLIAGETNAWIEQGIHKYMTGVARFASNPMKAVNLAKDYNILEGTFADYTQRGIGKLKSAQDLLMFGQQAGEYIIRSKMFSAELTPEEWKSGKIDAKRVNELKKTIATTQGVYSKTESPLWVQTTLGRVVMQMNRWRLTNALYINRVLSAAYKEARSGKWGPNLDRAKRIFVAYGLFTYLANEAYQFTGNKQVEKMLRSGSEMLNSFFSLFTEGQIYKMWTQNPTYQMFGKIFFTVQDLLSHLGLAKEPSKIEFRSGLENLYIKPLEQPKESGGGGPSIKIPSVKVPTIKIPNIKL